MLLLLDAQSVPVISRNSRHPYKLSCLFMHAWKSSAGPYEVPTHAKPSTQPRAPRLVDGPLCDGALGSHAGDYTVEVGFYDHAAHDHLAQRGVQRLEVED